MNIRWVKQYPDLIENKNNHLFTFSSDKETFDNKIGLYEKALKNSGYDCKLNYVPLLAALSETRTVISILRNRKYSKQPIKPRIVDLLGFLNKNKVLGSRYLSAVYYL